MDYHNNLAFQKKKCYFLIDRLPLQKKKLVLRALKSAEKWHKGQARIDIRRTPYIIHIYRVLQILVDELYVKDQDIIAAAALHDVVEDCGVPINTIDKMFGQKVEKIVAGESQNLFPNRKSYMEHIQRADLKVKLLKISDRLDNLRTISHPVIWPKEKVAQYVIESEKYIIPFTKKVNFNAAKKMIKLTGKIRATRSFKPLFKKLSNKKVSYEDTEPHKPKFKSDWYVQR